MHSFYLQLFRKVVAAFFYSKNPGILIAKVFYSDEIFDKIQFVIAIFVCYKMDAFHICEI